MRQVVIDTTNLLTVLFMHNAEYLVSDDNISRYWTDIGPNMPFPLEINLFEDGRVSSHRLRNS